RGKARVAFGIVRRAVGLLEQACGAAPEDLLDGREIIWSRSAIAANLEPPVVGLLRRATLERDHRGNRVVRAQVGDVEALDPHGQRLQIERLLQGGERVHPLLAPPLGPQLVLAEGEPSVALSELPQPPLVAALGAAHLDRAATTARERLP